MSKTKDVVSFIMDIVEHFHDQSLNRMLTSSEQGLYHEGMKLIEMWADSSSKMSELFSGVLTTSTDDKN